MQPDDPEWEAQVTLARRRLVSLARVAVADYADSWYAADVLGPALELVGRHARGLPGGISHLMVEMPTQTGKTLHTCLFICQLLGQDPRLKIQDIGYGEVFMQMCGEYVSMIANSEGFAAAFPDVRLGKPQMLDAVRRVNDKAVNAIHQVDTLYRHPSGAWRRAGGSARFHSIKGSVSGRPGDVMMLEDPYSGWDGPTGAFNAGWNQKLINFYEGVFRRRMKGERSCEIHAYTPWTDTDIRMHVLGVWEKKKVPYLRIKLPMKQRALPGDYPEERDQLLASRGALRGLAKLLRVDEAVLKAAVRRGDRCRPYDRRAPGENLPLPTRTPEWVESESTSMLSREKAALWDLWPIGDLINRFPKSLWRPWDPVQLPLSDLESYSIQVDPNGDETEAGAFASMGVWASRLRPGRGPADYPRDLYRVDQLRDRPGYSDFCDMTARLAARWPEARKIKMERTAHGRSASTDRTFLGRPEFRGRTFEWVDPEESKGVRWDRMEIPLKQGCGHVPIASSPCGRVDPAWVTDREGASADDVRRGDALGFLSEIAGAGRLLVCDRVDEASQAFDHYRAGGPASTDDAWSRLRSLRGLGARV